MNETKQAQHMPGPLEARLEDGDGMSLDPYWSVGKTVLISTPDVREREWIEIAQVDTEDNARLFAAAPDLLEALERIVDHVRLRGPMTPEWDSLLTTARQVIKQARGEAS